MELKTITLEFDENQMCTLHTMMNWLFADHPQINGQRADMKEIRNRINQATQEILEAK